MDLFDTSCPISIILGGDKQAEEINFVKAIDEKIWKEKLISDPLWKFQRQNLGTEQRRRLGPRYDLDKLKGLLKDEPLLLSLKKYPVHDIPALPVFDK